MLCARFSYLQNGRLLAMQTDENEGWVWTVIDRTTEVSIPFTQPIGKTSAIHKTQNEQDCLHWGFDLGSANI